MSASKSKPQRNFVKEAAKIKLNKQAIKKQYQPGVYAQHHPSQCEHMLKNRPIHLKLDSATELKETIQVVSDNNVRNLLVPSDTFNVYPTIWPSNELSRIKQAGHIVTKAEWRQHLDQLEADKRRLEQECAQRKQTLKEMDKKRLAGLVEKKADDDDDDDGSVRVLDRAFVAKQEETVEVQRANRLIMAAKCQAIREAQVAEKSELKRELRDEDHRLEQMMMNDRQKALRVEDIRRDESERKNVQHGLEIKNQLRERELAKLREAERIEEEAKAMAQAQIAITLDILEKERDRKQQMIKTRTELQKSNEMNEFFKSLAFEEQRIAEMKAAEFMRQKQERERQLAAEQRLVKEQKQRESDRMLALQIKRLDTKNEQEAMDMRRSQEEKEREFRNKELEAAISKKKRLQELEMARLNQLEEIKRQKAMQMVREEVDFKSTIGLLKQAAEKERLEQEKKVMLRDQYRSDIMDQIKQKELMRRENKTDELKHVAQHQAREQQRTRDIQAIIDSKIESMRRASVPEKIIKDIERQLQVSQKLTKQ